MPAKIARRFASVETRLAGATLLVLAVVTAVLYFEVSTSERERLLSAKSVAATMVAQLLSAGEVAPLMFGDQRGAQEQVSLLKVNEEVIYAAVWALDEDAPPGLGALTKVGEIRRPGLAFDEAPSNVDWTRRSTDWVLVNSRVLDPAGQVLGVTQVAFSLERENAAIVAAKRRTLFIALATALGVGLVLVGLTRTLIVRRLARLAAAATRLEHGESVDIVVDGADEVTGLARALSTMTHAIAEREARIAARNRDMRRVLDNVAEGFLTVDRRGLMSDERSRVLDEWFGPPSTPTQFFAYIAQISAPLEPWMRLGWIALEDDFMPAEVVLDQLPRRFARSDRFYELDYRPICDGTDRLQEVLVVIRDVTERVAKERAEQAQREGLAIFRHVLRDRTGFGEFMKEASALVASVERSDGSSSDDVVRAVHTLKGNAALFEIESITRHCHELEHRMVEEHDGPTEAERTQLRALWSAVEKTCAQLDPDTHRIELEPDDYSSLLAALDRRVDHAVVAASVRAWRYERASTRMGRLSVQARALARRLGKAGVEVETRVHPADLRLPADRWAGFWSVFAHVLRNTVDHGVETPGARGAAGKAGAGRISLSLDATNTGVELTVADDGPGIAWEKIRTRAAALGMPHATQADLEEALFADRVSSRDVATETSGRGVGMGAVREMVRASGGRVRVETAAGRGTTLRFSFPRAMLGAPLSHRHEAA